MAVCPFGTLFPFWYVWTKKNLAALVTAANLNPFGPFLMLLDHFLHSLAS
jgi:hypothetical protein